MLVIENRVLEHLAVRERGDDRVEEMQAEILRRARLLLDRDRKLVEMIVGAKVNVRQAGEWLGIPAGTVSRRMVRLAKRLHDPIAAALAHDRCPLPGDYRQVGIEYFLQGIEIRAIAQKHDITLGEVRRMIQFIRGWQRGASIRRELNH